MYIYIYIYICIHTAREWDIWDIWQTIIFPGAEAARDFIDFIQAMPGSTPTRKSVKMDAQEARNVAKGYLQEPGTGWVCSGMA